MSEDIFVCQNSVSGGWDIDIQQVEASGAAEYHTVHREALPSTYTQNNLVQNVNSTDDDVERSCHDPETDPNISLTHSKSQ